MRVWRSITSPLQAAQISTSPYSTYNLSATNTPNIQYANNFTLALTCSTVRITTSETPV